MSCKDCEKEQKEGAGAYYYRWDNANIEIRCCSKHAKELIGFLNKTSYMRRDK